MAIDNLPNEIKIIFTEIAEHKDDKSTSNDWHRIVSILKKGTDNKGNDSDVAKRVSDQTKAWANPEINPEVKNNADARKLAFLAKHVKWIPSNKFLRNIVTNIFLKFCNVADFLKRAKSVPIEVSPQTQQQQVQKKSGGDEDKTSHDDTDESQKPVQQRNNTSTTTTSTASTASTASNSIVNSSTQAIITIIQNSQPDGSKSTSKVDVIAQNSQSGGSKSASKADVMARQIARLNELKIKVKASEENVERLRKEGHDVEDIGEIQAISGLILHEMMEQENGYNMFYNNIVTTHGQDLLKKMQLNDLIQFFVDQEARAINSPLLADPKVFQIVADVALRDSDSLYYTHEFDHRICIEFLTASDGAGKPILSHPEIVPIALPLLQKFSASDRLRFLSHVNGDNDEEPAMITLLWGYPQVAAMLKEDIQSCKDDSYDFPNYELPKYLEVVASFTDASGVPMIKSLVREGVITIDEVKNALRDINNSDAWFIILNIAFEDGNTLLQDPEFLHNAWSDLKERLSTDQLKAVLTHANAKGEFPIRHASKDIFLKTIFRNFLLDHKALLESLEPLHVLALYSKTNDPVRKIGLYDALDTDEEIIYIGDNATEKQIADARSENQAIQDRLDLHISLLGKLDSKDLNALVKQLLDLPRDVNSSLHYDDDTKLKYCIPLFAKLDSPNKKQIATILLAHPELLKKFPKHYQILRKKKQKLSIRQLASKW